MLEPVAPPKKPPRPGAPCHLANLGPVESYNEGVKVHVTPTLAEAHSEVYSCMFEPLVACTLPHTWLVLA